MIVFPLAATLISLACATVAGRRYVARRRPHELYWCIAFGFFALGAGAAVAGYLAGWTPFLVRLFYASGAILTTGFLGLGSLSIALGRRLDRWGPGVALALTALGFAFVANTPVDTARLHDAWYALERDGSPTRLLAALTNSVGATLVIGVALYSIATGRRRGLPRERTTGLLLIAGGTLVVASGSALIKLSGDSRALFVAMAPGVALIMLGYLQANRAARPAPAPAGEGAADAALGSAAPALLAGSAVSVGPEGSLSDESQPADALLAGPAPPPAARPALVPQAGLRLRALGPADAAAVRAILAGACPVVASPLAAGGRYRSDEALAADLARPGALWLGAEVEGRLAALARLCPGAEPATRHTARLDAFAVAPDLTGRGIGTALLAEVLCWADETMGLARLDLWVFAGDPAAPDAARATRFFVRHGFQPEGTLRNAFFTGGRHRAVVVLARVRG